MHKSIDIVEMAIAVLIQKKSILTAAFNRPPPESKTEKSNPFFIATCKFLESSS